MMSVETISRPATEHFIPEQFRLSRLVNGEFKLDHEVAAEIANEIWVNNKRGNTGNDYPEDMPFIVNPSNNERHSFAPHYLSDTYVPNYSASFIAPRYSEYEPGVNELFGRSVQRALDHGERRRRHGIVSTALTLVAGTAVTVFGGEVVDPAVVNLASPVILGGFGIPRLYDTYRRAVTNPNFGRIYEPRLKLAQERAARLALPPVVTRR